MPFHYAQWQDAVTIRTESHGEPESAGDVLVMQDVFPSSRN